MLEIGNIASRIVLFALFYKLLIKYFELMELIEYNFWLIFGLKIKSFLKIDR